MKYFALLITTFALMSCHPHYAKYHVPAGHKTCNSSKDCNPGEYCGFVGVDTYPVCKQ